MLTLVLFIALVAFVLADFHLYTKAKHPERANMRFSTMPGSGFVAYLRFGPNRK